MMHIAPAPCDLHVAHEARVAQLRHEIHASRPHRPSGPVRRWVGRQMVRLGNHLAADPSLQPARSQ